MLRLAAAILTSTALAVTAVAAGVLGPAEDVARIHDADQAAVLVTPDHRMSMNYTAGDVGKLAVVAEFAVNDRRIRLELHMANGDHVAFALPGYPGTVYSFQRDGQTVTSRATTNEIPDASAS